VSSSHTLALKGTQLGFLQQQAAAAENRFRFIQQNPPADFADNSLSNWINFRVPVSRKRDDAVD